MKKYRIYSKLGVVPQIVTVGWSISAFLFGGFWAIFHKLYRLGFGVIILVMLFYMVTDNLKIDNNIKELLEILIWSAIHLFFGFKGTKWIEQRFIQQGYHLHDTVESDSYLEALSILKFKLDSFDDE